MKQLSLLNQPRARAKGPETSKLAAQAVTPAAGELEQKIVAVLEFYRLTAEGIAHFVERMQPGRWVESTIRGAVSRSAEKGLIEPCGTGLTSRGRSAIAYRRVR